MAKKKGYQDIKHEVVVKRTGKSFDEWQKILDKFNVKKNGHNNAVKFLIAKFKINTWWAHVIVIRYEYKKAQGIKK